MSIMPGIENFEPERTETRSGLATSPKRRVVFFSSFLTASTNSPTTSRPMDLAERSGWRIAWRVRPFSCLRA